MQPGVNNAGADDGTVQTAAPAPTSSGGGTSWLKSLLPTIGGIGGGILGGVVDAASLGLAAPLINPITGAALGGAAGQAVENATNGKNPLEANDVTSGIENGVGQLVGAGAGKVVGALGEGLGSAGTKLAAAAGDKAADQSAGDLAASEAQRVADTFGGVKTGQGDVGAAVAKAKELGFSNPTPTDLANIGKIYTGSNPETGTGVLNFLKQNAIEQGGGSVKLDDATSKLHDMLAEPGNQQLLGGEAPVSNISGRLPKVPNTPAARISAQFRAMLPGSNLTKGGQLTTDLTPQQGVDLTKQLFKQAQSTGKITDGLGAVIPEKQAENNVWKSLYSTVKDATYNRPEVNGIVANTQVTPDLEATIDDAIKSNGVTDPEQAAAIKADLTNTINGAQHAPDLIKAEAPMVNVAKVGEAATKDVNSDVTSARAVRRAKAGITPDSLGTSLEPVQAGAEGKSGIIKNVVTAAKATHNPVGAVLHVGSKLHEAGLTPSVVKGLGNVVARTAPLVKPAVQVASNIPNMAAGMSAGASAIPSTGDTSMQPAAAQPTNPINSELGSLTALQNAAPTVLGPQLAPTIASLTGQVQQNQLAGNAISALSPTFNNAGGAAGPVGGILDRILAAVPGTAQNTYSRQQQATAAQIAKILGITPEAAMAMLPQLSQSSATAAPQMANTSGLVGQLTAGLPAS